MDFNYRIESFELEGSTWERFAAEAGAERKQNMQQFDLGIAQANKDLVELLTTINQDNPTTQARKLYTWMLKCTEENETVRHVKMLPEKGELFNAGYSGTLSKWLRDFDYTLTELHREAKGMDARSTERQAWLKGENQMLLYQQNEDAV